MVFLVEVVIVDDDGQLRKKERNICKLQYIYCFTNVLNKISSLFNDVIHECDEYESLLPEL